MNPSDTTAVNPREDGSKKADRMNENSMPRPYITEPKLEPEVSPGPDTRVEPVSPK